MNFFYLFQSIYFNTYASDFSRSLKAYGLHPSRDEPYCPLLVRVRDSRGTRPGREWGGITFNLRSK